MSTPVYVQRGVAFKDTIVYQLPSGSFQTGKVQANFTIRLSKDGVGNQSTSGITITETDAANNPGDYVLAFTAASFLAVNGEYELLIFDTATPTYSWEQVYTVTPTGAPGSSSSVFFQSSVTNGRITDGTNPLSGATIYVKSGTDTINVLTSDPAGNYLFYAGAGTYTVFASRSGYVQASATVTFTTTASTGPGIDIVLTAATGGSTIFASDLWTYARQQAHDNTGAAADQKVKRAVNRSMDMVAKDRVSNWWLKRASLAVSGSLTFTITLTKGSSTATSTSGAFPSWAASLARFNVNSQVVDIISQTNTTNVVMSGPWNGTTASYSAILFRDTYALPTNMYQFGRILPGQRWGWGGDPVSAEILWEAQNAANYQQQGPSMFAVFNGNLVLGPYPSTDQTYIYTYHARPAQLVNSGDVADIDPAQIEIIHRAIDYQVALEFGGSVAGDAPGCMKAYTECRSRSVTTDRLPADLPGMGGSGGRMPPYWKAPRAP